MTGSRALGDPSSPPPSHPQLPASSAPGMPLPADGAGTAGRWCWPPAHSPGRKLRRVVLGGLGLGDGPRGRRGATPCAHKLASGLFPQEAGPGGQCGHLVPPALYRKGTRAERPRPAVCLQPGRGGLFQGPPPSRPGGTAVGGRGEAWAGGVGLTTMKGRAARTRVPVCARACVREPGEAQGGARRPP